VVVEGTGAISMPDARDATPLDPLLVEGTRVAGGAPRPRPVACPPP
jgi:hypothetical protein